VKILVINGPNLNLLGKREPAVYGSFTLNDVMVRMKQVAAELSVEIAFYQSNHEGELVQKIQDSMGTIDALIINPGAYTHTSVALRDAILSTGIPTVETHISNIYKREEFRHHSYLAGVVAGQISGFGMDSYILALRAAVGIITDKERHS